jgi:hypothetical protein
MLKPILNGFAFCANNLVAGKPAAPTAAVAIIARVKLLLFNMMRLHICSIRVESPLCGPR